MGDVKFSVVKKRDGRIVPFDGDRIFNAVLKAFKASGEGAEEEASIVTNLVLRLMSERIDGKHIPEVEEIQDIVEESLMRAGYYHTAKAYIIYREKRYEARETQKVLFDGLKIVDDYLQKDDWRVNENSNMTYSLQGLNYHISSSIVARYWLHKIYPPEVAKAHLDGDFHIHDLGILSAYCVGWDLADLLLKGFGGVPGKIESKPPKHLRSALGQAVNFLYTLQGEAAGAQAFSNFDTLLAPFVRWDDLKYKDVKQAIQEFVFNMNVPTRVGFQSVFSNLTFDLTPPSGLAKEKVIIGGERQDAYYGDFQEEMDMINQAFAEVMLEGDGKGRIFSFPIPTYNITKDFPWDKPAYQPIWEMTAKYGIPYFANFINSDLDPDDVRSMCCRLRLNTSELKKPKLSFNFSPSMDTSVPQTTDDRPKKRTGGLFASAPMTGSIGVVTINLPRIAYLSESEDEFFSRLERLMQIAKTSLELKRKVVEQFTENGLYPYSKYYLSPIKEEKGSYWANHFSTIGIIGMHEAAMNLLGLPLIAPEAKKFAEKVMDFMLKKLEEFKEETGNLYNLEASPAEGASYRLAKIDRRRFEDIITSGTYENPYYTNSSMLPVDYSDDLFEVLEHQDSLQSRYTGGTVLHIFLGEKIDDTRTVKDLIKTVFENYSLPYISITPTFSVCPVHGYIPGEYWVCPYDHTEEQLKKYGKLMDNGELVVPTEVYSRVVGYYRPVQNWNFGKKQEFRERKTYNIFTSMSG